MNKQTAEKIYNAGVKLLLDAGAIATPDGWRNYQKNSRGGVVDISIKLNKWYKRRGYYVSVFAQFEDTAAAKAAGIDCGFVGKYNFHDIETVDSMENVIYQYR